MTERTTYLDHAATTPMRVEAIEAMLPFLRDRYANPSGSHRAARSARLALDEARDVVAACLGGDAGEVVFTGVLRRHGGSAVCPATEHHAVLHVVEHGGGRVIGVDGHGVVDLDQLADALTPDTRVVSVMAVNNEAGTIQPLERVATVVRERAPQAVLHTDAVQAPCWLDLRPLTAIVDLLALSAHKFGGPKGVGVLWARRGVTFEPLLQGGGQERDRRSGTHNVAGIVAAAEALRITDAGRPIDTARTARLRDRLCDGLVAATGAIETVPRTHKIAGSAHLCFDGVENEALLFLLDQAGICASAASACASGAMEPSHVLSAMGVARSLAGGAVRFSLGPDSTDADVDHVLDVVPAMVARLRAGVR